MYRWARFHMPPLYSKSFTTTYAVRNPAVYGPTSGSVCPAGSRCHRAPQPRYAAQAVEQFEGGGNVEPRGVPLVDDHGQRAGRHHVAHMGEQPGRFPRHQVRRHQQQSVGARLLRRTGVLPGQWQRATRAGEDRHLTARHLHGRPDRRGELLHPARVMGVLPYAF